MVKKSRRTLGERYTKVGVDERELEEGVFRKGEEALKNESTVNPVVDAHVWAMKIHVGA